MTRGVTSVSITRPELALSGGFEQRVQFRSLQQSAIQNNRADILRVSDIGKRVVIEQ